MLRILSVNPTGFTSYGICESIQVAEQGLVNLTGRNKDKEGASNGSGKTSLLNAIVCCLYGRVESFVSGSLVVNDALINEPLGLGMCPRTEWINSVGEHWRVTFSRKWSGTSPYPQDSSLYPYSGTDLYLEQYVNGSWIDRRSAEMPKTRQRVLEAVGITYDRFLCTSYLTQQAGGLSFIRGTNSQQMSGIFESLGLRDWDKVMEGFKTNRDYASLRVTQLESSLAQVDSALAVLVLPTDQEIVAEGQKEAERAKHIEVAQGHLTVAEKMLSDMKVQLALLEQNVNPYTQPLANANGQLAWLKQTGPNRQSTDLISIDQQIYSANSQIKACESSAKAKNCPTCKQSLPTASTQNVEQEIQKHRKQLSYLEANRANIVKTMSDAFSKELAEAEAKVALLIQNSNIFEASGVVEQKAAAKKSIVQYESQVSHWKVELQRLHGEQAQYTAWVNKNAQITEKRSKLIEQRQVIEAEYAVVKKDHDEWAWLWKNSGDKGFKSWKLASSIDRLNAILAEVLGEIDPSLKVWCQSFRYKAKAPKQVVKQDDLIHEFTIFVRDGTKSVVPLELYSGGESSVIAIALMVAQWRLSSEQGGGTNLLALDEIASALDQRSSQLVANFIESLKTVGKTVIMISHNNLIDIMDFDHKWRVTKKNDISSIEVDPCEE